MVFLPQERRTPIWELPLLLLEVGGHLCRFSFPHAGRCRSDVWFDERWSGFLFWNWSHDPKNLASAGEGPIQGASWCHEVLSFYSLPFPSAAESVVVFFCLFSGGGEGTWLDNFCKLLPVGLHREGEKDFKINSWTVECQFQSLYPISSKLELNADGSIKPCMPPNLFDRQLFEDLNEEMQLITQQWKFDDSIIYKVLHKLKYCTIPPSLDFSGIPLRHRERPLDQHRFLDRFKPVKLHDVVIGSNLGLGHLLKQTHFKVLNSPHDTSYHVHVVDVAIFDRTLRVMYDKRVASRALMERVPVLLGLWHPVKHAMELIWTRYSTFLFAPLTHSVWPGSSFFDKPKTIRLHEMFAILAVAYDEGLRTHLHSCIEHLKAERPVHFAELNWARNLFDLFELFIPVVSLLTLSRGDKVQSYKTCTRRRGPIAQ